MIKALIVFNLFLFTSPLFAKKVVFLGDSLTEGYGISQNKAFPELIKKQLIKDHPNLEVVNAGSSGSTSASAVPRLKWLIKSKPQIIIIALGGNDGLRGVKLNSTKKNLKNAIKIALDAKAKILLAGVRIPTNYGEKYRQDFEKIYKELAKEFPIKFVPFILKDVAGIKKLNLPDGIHPNEKGHKIIADNLLSTIKEML